MRKSARANVGSIFVGFLQKDVHFVGGKDVGGGVSRLDERFWGDSEIALKGGSVMGGACPFSYAP